MKPAAVLLLALMAASRLWAATTIDPDNRYAYGANIGWIDWRGDVSSGAVVGEYVCSGYIYSANVGWIHLGSGAPANGVRYANDSATDYGVNHDAAGNLSGMAWGANIGWSTFTNRDAAGATYSGPRIDLRTGRMSGFIYGANVGWISLSNAFAFVQTGSIQPGPDTDGDGLPDNWERERAGNLTTLSGNGDNDSDGFTNQEEYIADTDPTEEGSNLRITAFDAGAGGANNVITWLSRPTRQYFVRKRAALESLSGWIDSGLGLISPDSGSTTSRLVTDTPAARHFFAIEAVRPLSP